MAAHSMKAIKVLPTTKVRKFLQWFQLCLVLDLPYKKKLDGNVKIVDNKDSKVGVVKK